MAVSNLTGRTLNGRYQIESLIGQGGMASVYKANDQNLRRTVAIKVIHPHLSGDTEFFRRFEEEATSVARLRHPNIVQVYDYNHDGDLYYMVMEFIVGETLQSRLKRLTDAQRKMPVKEAMKFTMDICEAADYAHQRGMIHRDIKPANVMLDVNGKAILMDFGIARMVGGSQHTATGAVLGTARYMSPEQIQGLHADARADIYSLGVTLYEMLSGRPPFIADSAMTLMMMHLNDPVPDVRAIQPETPAELVTILQKSLAKNRDERFQSAMTMAAALRQALERADKAQPAPVVSVPSVPPATEATFIEASPRPEAGGTIIEPAVKKATAVPTAAPAQKPVAKAETFVEKPAPTTPSKPTPIPVDTAFPATPDQSAFPVGQRRSRGWVLILTVLLLALLGGGGYFAYQKFFQPGSSLPAVIPPAATVTATIETKPILLPTNTTEATRPVAVLLPTNTATLQATATATLLPSPTPTATLPPTPAPVVIGGADKLAYLSGGEIWTADLDGGSLTQVTKDGANKIYIRWLPDGQGFTYISGKCIRTVSLTGDDQVLTCFNNAQYLESFEPSPDGTQVVISVDHQLYLVPFDLQRLKNVSTHDALAKLAGCADFAPYKRNFARSIRWSKDGSQWAALVLGVLEDGRRGDIIQVFAVNRCIPNPMISVQFPGTHFTYKDYDQNPTIEDFTWDSKNLFVFHGNVRNGGFGDLHVFNTQTFKPSLSINPLGSCCYRDPQWSPDGAYLLFAFQDYRKGAASTTQLYYIRYGEIGSGATFKPLPLPDITDPLEKPQAILRVASTP